MIATLVYVDVKPECVEKFKEITAYNHNNTRKEPGNIRFDVLWAKEDPTRFVLYEVFLFIRNQCKCAVHRNRMNAK